ncbi:MAG: alkaline phosphatase family protein [bacterium]
MSIKRKFLLIGLDGATFDIINPLVAEGKLPNIASLMKNGVSAPLKSTIPPNTAVAWTSMTTGVNPGKHGIFYFTESPHKNYCQEHLLNASDIGFKKLWEILSGVGEKSIVIGVPFTYPPTEINGIIITGEKGKERVITHPPEFAQELTKRFKRPNEWTKLKTLFGSIPTAEFLERYLNAQIKQIEFLQEVMKYLIKEYEWTFFMGAFLSPDQVQHFFWKYMDKSHILHNPKSPSKYKDAIYKIYQLVDSAIGQILSLVDDETTVIIASDHGGGPIHKYLQLNMWLEQQGYLTRKREVSHRFKTFYPTLYKCLTKVKLTSVGNILPPKLRNLKIPMVKKVESTSAELINWVNTKAYATHWGISVNLQDREREGTVPSNEYEGLIKEITDKLYEMQAPQTNKKIIQKVIRKEELYNGPYVKNSTDILVIPDPLYGIRGNFIKDKQFLQQIDNTEAISSNHRQDGIFIMKGHGIKKGLKLNGTPEIVDITPTILYLMSQPVLAQMDGKVIKEAIEPAFLQENPIRISEEDGFVQQIEGFKLPPEEEAAAKEQLKALGYIE